MKQIDIIPWDENFNTGVEVIDMQHHRLVDIINNLATQFAFHDDNVDLKMIFNELIAYTQYHFDSEEAIWKQYLQDHESEITHRKAHHEFVKKLHELAAQRHNQPLEEVAENTLDFLVQWLVAHILESDRYMAYKVAALQEGASLHDAQMIAKDKMNVQERKMLDLLMSIYKTLSYNTLRLMREYAQEIQMERQLQSKERLLRTVIDEIPDLLMLKDDQDNFLLANQTLANIYHTTTQKIVGKNESDFHFFEKIENKNQPNVLNVMRHEAPHITYEENRNLKTDEIRHFKSTKKSFIDEDGKRKNLIISHDITDEIQIKNELYQQRMLLEALIYTLPDLVWLKNPEGVYLKCNPRFEDFFGAKEADIVGKTDYDFVDKALADFFTEHDQKAVKNKIPTVNEEWITFASDGHQELLETIKTPMYDEHGILIGVLGIGRDMTQKQQLIESIQEQEHKYKMLMQLSSEGLFLMSLDGKLLDYSQEAKNLLGYSDEEMRQLYINDWEAGYSKEEVLNLLHEVGKEPHSIETTHRRKDGTFYDAAIRCVKITLSGIDYIYSSVRDITEQNRQTQILRHQKEEFETIFKSTIDGLALLDLESRFVKFNDAYMKMTGYDYQEMLHKTCIEISVPEDLQRTKAIFKEVLNTGYVKNFEKSCHKKDGTVISIAMSISLMPDKKHFLVSAKDMTEKIKLRNEQELLLSLFDKGDSVLFRWNNDDVWSIDYVSDNVGNLLGYDKALFMSKQIAYASCIYPEDLERVIKEVHDATTQNLDFFKHEPYRIILKSGEIKWVMDYTVIQKNKMGNTTHYLGYLTDITDQIEKDIQIRDKLQKFIDTQNSIVILTDAKNMKFANRKFLEFFGYADIASFFKDHQCICERFIEHHGFFHMGKVKKNEANWIESILKLNGRKRIVSINDALQTPHAFLVAVSRYDKDDYIVTFSDISDTMIEMLHLERQAMIDELTKTYNRAYFNHNIQTIFKNRKESNSVTGVIFFDIDHFKHINDTYGHDVGDEILRMVVKLVQRYIRDTDKLIRWGGEEFVIITETNSLESVVKNAENLRSVIKNHHFGHDVGMVTCSFGCAVYHAGQDLAETIKKADEAMYEAKAAGRNLVRAFEE
jgi:diguanylate cyclase (GGDEF)-like protein/hemerythrin-like metal-binding protein/PAS domain S-box-containing protein